MFFFLNFSMCSVFYNEYGFLKRGAKVLFLKIKNDIKPEQWQYHRWLSQKDLLSLGVQGQYGQQRPQRIPKNSVIIIINNNNGMMLKMTTYHL